MTHDDQGAIPWQETDSAAFIERGAVFTPARDEIEAALLALIPAHNDEAFTVVEIGVGAGWLSEAILRAYPNAAVVGRDGSPRMRQAAAARLAPYGARADVRPFRLEDDAWLADLRDIRAFVSCLVIHHLDDGGKRALFAALHERLAPGGALLVADLVAPTSEPARRYAARSWDAAVRRQSLDLTGDTAAYDEFVATQWNLFDTPDPVDMPSPLADQLHWLADIGYVGADAFWVRAGHAVYGGYRASTSPP
ncbi:MAG: class I SAM-dependent methyltransferase [Anaerolineae bacterium]